MLLPVSRGLLLTLAAVRCLKPLRFTQCVRRFWSRAHRQRLLVWLAAG